MNISSLSIYFISILTFVVVALQFEPYIQKGNEGIVHHFVVYECHGKFNDSHYGTGYDCTVPNMPFKKCLSPNMVAVWGIGGEVGLNLQM